MSADDPVSGLLRIPAGFASSGDPIEGNPFDLKSPSHSVWKDATRRAEEELCRFNSELLRNRDFGPNDVVAHAVGCFDIWANRAVQVVRNDGALRSYDQWLVTYAEAWLKAQHDFFPPPIPIDDLLRELQLRLSERIQWWKAEARRYLGEQKAEAGIGSIPTESAQHGMASIPLKNKFVQEGETWSISFADETCKLPARMIGLGYILVLLKNPGLPMRALELQDAVAGNPVESRPAAECIADSITEDAEDDLGYEGDCSSSSQRDFSRGEIVDYTARKQYEKRLLELEKSATDAIGIGDVQKGEEAQREYDEIDSYLNRSRNKRGLPRVFAGENEKARVSITKALDRVCKKIRPQAPKTADHLRSQIKTGTEFVYQDGSTSWEF